MGNLESAADFDSEPWHNAGHQLLKSTTEQWMTQCIFDKIEQISPMRSRVQIPIGHVPHVFSFSHICTWINSRSGLPPATIRNWIHLSFSILASDLKIYGIGFHSTKNDI
jgi:hypothetical protein